ncbi:DsbA family protein [Modestobacter versicolor]|uniref:Disulfide bond formation protein DsbA n=1 Tax=Modestobacter versicolor TaxID=429133 RepID=A0A323V840_9ACTN|nr:thioredoxin domain-containing protein [Modestobacter versicolor]MBB3676257.1 protein-disulfide isomerase [Modestobacter versicolor]PZA20874.1 disulfide bond formation protein DsbA [Modestobacter versicolor]
MSGETKREAARQRIAAKRAAEAAAHAAAARRRRAVTGGVLAAAVLVVALIVVIVVQTQRTSTSADAAAPPNTTDGGYAFAVGSADAPVTMDVYEDFQCPVCAQLESTAGSTIAELVDDGTVQVRYHGMAFLDRASSTEYSTRALNAAAVVAESGTDAFRAFHELLFANQPEEGSAGLSDDQLVEYATQAGATGADVAQGIEDRRYADWVAAATDRASEDGVTGTPTVFVDGDQLDGDQLTPDGIAAAVAAAQG